MNNRLVKYSLVAGLALSMTLPAVAYSQLNAPQGPRFGAGGGGPGNFAEAGELAPQRGRGRLDNERPQRAAARTGRRRGNGRGFAGPSGRGNFGGSGRGGFGAGFAGRGGRSSLAARALARADQIGLAAEQREQILAAQRSMREASINRRAETQITELELGDLMRAETRDIAAVETTLRELAEQRIAEQTGALRLDEAVREVLSAEQIDELGDAARVRGLDRPARRGGRGFRNNAR